MSLNNKSPRRSTLASPLISHAHYGFWTKIRKPACSVLHKQRAPAIKAMPATQTCHQLDLEGDIWLLVLSTLCHPSLKALPSRQAWTQYSQQLDIDSAPVLLSLDCEMCITSHSMRELVGLSIVNSSGKCVLKMLVKPQGRVRDWRTIVTGLDNTTMQGVTLTKRDAREAVKKLLRGNVVLVGHALQNDLDALQLSPAAFIDTALLYFFVDRRSNPPSLADLALQVLGQSLRSESAAHDCQQDAAAAMQLVNHALQHGIPQDMQAPPKKKADLKKLLVRGIPRSAKPADMLQLFAACTSIPPTFQEDPNRGRGLIVFDSVDDANTAFAQLSAPQVIDNFGRAEKQVLITTGTGYSKMIKIYKMPVNDT